jgi:crotonobetainyl-CoA:carnitine CoA-transferase CaiB-like acyl-CoA transferase
VYRCGVAEDDDAAGDWVAISARDDAQWAALADAIGAHDLRELTLAERHNRHDELDRRIGEAELAEELGRRPHPSAATLRAMLADREAEQEQHRAAVDRLQHGRVVAAIPRNLREQWPRLSLDRQRAILAAVIERIEVHPQGKGKAFDPNAVKVIRRA